MNFNTTSDSLIRVASAEEGTAENPPGSNDVKYNAWAGMQGEPWCATFVRWCLDQCGVKAPFSSYVPNIKSVAQANGCWISGDQIALPGDIVCFAFPGEDHTPNHTGIVKSVNGVRDIVTVEGNTDEAGGRTGGKVMEKHRTDYIDGYFRPTYTASAENGEDDMPYMLRLNADFDYPGLTPKAGDIIYILGQVRYPVNANDLASLQADSVPLKSASPTQYRIVLNATVDNVRRLIAPGK